MINVIQGIVNMVLGEGVLDVAAVDPNLLLLAVFVMFFFVYLALRSCVRFFLNLGNRF